MTHTNQTLVTSFILKGISDIPELQAPVFVLVLLIVLMTLGGNMTILLLVFLDHALHTPMYFFLCNLSVLDMSSTSVTLLKFLHILISGDNTIYLTTCLGQMYVFLSLAGDTLLILTAMSYDRYVAICNPLHYRIVMNYNVCVLLATFCWLLGFIEAMPNLWLISGFYCYNSNEINHFFCDMYPLLKLSCSDKTILNIYLLITASLLVFLVPFLFTFISYTFIISTILKIRSNTGKRKAFYTCSSHLTVVTLLYATLSFQYLRPTSMDNLDYNKLFSLFNIAVVPVLNPLIYSLKNKDVKAALRRRLAFFKAKI